MNQRITLSRRELYDLVWSKPMRDVAVELGLSDVGLAKVCDRHRVPRPEQGYWNKIRADQPAKKTIFVETDDPHVNRIMLQGGISSFPEAARVVIQEARENRKHRPKSTTVAAQIPSQIVEDPHPAIAKTAKVLRKAVADSMGAVHANGEGLCGVSVASDRRERAIFFLDGLARELAKNGLALAPTGQAMSIEIGPDSAVFTLKERIRREKHVPTGEELAADEKRLQAVRKKYGAISWFERPSDRAYPEFDTIYTGELVLQVDGYSEGVRRTWADGRTQVIDMMIDDIVTGLRAILAARRKGEKSARRSTGHGRNFGSAANWQRCAQREKPAASNISKAFWIRAPKSQNCGAGFRKCRMLAIPPSPKLGA
jgi:hypothetical protein